MSKVKKKRILELTGMPLINFNSKNTRSIDSPKIPNSLLKVAQQQYISFYQYQVYLLRTAFHYRMPFTSQELEKKENTSHDESKLSLKRKEFSCGYDEITNEEGQRLLPTDLFEDEDDTFNNHTCKIPLCNSGELNFSLNDVKKKVPMREIASLHSKGSYKSFHLFPLSNDSDLLSNVRNNFCNQRIHNEDKSLPINSPPITRLDSLESTLELLYLKDHL